MNPRFLRWIGLALVGACTALAGCELLPRRDSRSKSEAPDSASTSNLPPELREALPPSQAADAPVFKPTRRAGGLSPE
ncbi:MAG: hypothetical protein IRY99_25435, partial [Isosphaeraceae bacterium]|nr:hypothetical protein [Isosphaeraceae bacterium]